MRSSINNETLGLSAWRENREMTSTLEASIWMGARNGGMRNIRVQDLPDHESVQTSDMALNHVKRFERNNRIGVDDSNSNVTDGRADLKKYPVYQSQLNSAFISKKL